MSRTILVVAGAAALCGAALTPAVALQADRVAPPPTARPYAANSHLGHHGDLATAVVRGRDGERVGKVWLRQSGGGVRVTARLHGLSPGFHGFHVHSTGVCDPQAVGGPFTSAGGHYPGSTGEAHAAHAGDLPAVLANADGSAYASFVTDRFSVAELVGGDGSAVMVHAGADNFANIPDRYTSSLSGETGPDGETLKAGDSGDRFACGVVSRS